MGEIKGDIIGNVPLINGNLTGSEKMPASNGTLADVTISVKQISDFVKKQIGDEGGGGGGSMSVDDIYNAICDTALVSPTISSSKWTVKNNTGKIMTVSEAGAKISGNNIEAENGFILKFEGKWKWNSQNSRKSPTRTSGTWGSTLPSSGVDSSVYTEDNIRSGKTFQQNIYAPKSGVTVSGSKLVRPQGGEDSSSCIVNAMFSHRYYYGLITSQTPNGDDIKGMTNTDLSNRKSRVIKGITNDLSHYFCYAYPKSLGTLSSAVYNGAMQIFDDFELKEVTVVNKAGVSIPYYAYVFKNVDAFENSTIDFK